MRAATEARSASTRRIHGIAAQVVDRSIDDDIRRPRQTTTFSRADDRSSPVVAVGLRQRRASSRSPLSPRERYEDLVLSYFPVMSDGFLGRRRPPARQITALLALKVGAESTIRSPSASIASRESQHGPNRAPGCDTTRSARERDRAAGENFDERHAARSTCCFFDKNGRLSGRPDVFFAVRRFGRHRRDAIQGLPDRHRRGMARREKLDTKSEMRVAAASESTFL
mmetsp:Transcript_19830/g.63805  ORF Transcript_19830/g.63805 Transcript_19830/m.63805 type:complete len:226 (+) Transcript_19830:54-731(+)